MSIRKVGAATVAALTGTTVLVAGPATPAAADTRAAIGITSVGDMLVDGVHQRVFVSDPAAGTVLATDYEGNPLGTAPVTGAGNLALSADSSRLYVASTGDAAIFELDTTTLDRIARYTTGGAAPKDVAAAGGRIWFSYTGDTGLGTIDPAAEPPVVTLDRFDTGGRAAELDTARDEPNRIGVSGGGRSAILDVSGDTVTEVASAPNTGGITDLAISPDGTRIVTADVGAYTATVRDADDFATRLTLPIEYLPLAVDIASDGTIAVGAPDVGGKNLYLFTPAGELIKTITFATNGRGLDHGVAWASGGEPLFAVSANGNAYSLLSHTGTRVAPTTLTLSGPSESTPGVPVTIRGRLTSTRPLPAGTVVRISRSAVSLGTAVVAANGSFTFTDTPTSDGLASWQVTFPGSATHQNSLADVTVLVRRATPTVTLFGPSTALPGDPITVDGRLTASVPLAGSTVQVSRDGTALGSVTVDANSDFTFTDTAPGEGSVAYRFAYAGGDVTLPAESTHTVVVSRAVSTVTLAGPSTATRGKAFTFTGALTAPHPLPAGAKVSISRADLESPAGKSLGSTTVGADGSFRVTDTPPAGGTVTYQVGYAGDATHSAASSTRAVAVSRAGTAVTLTNKGKIFEYGKTVAFTARLGTTYKNRVVELWADPAGADQPRRLLKRATVNSRGDVTASLKLTRDTTVSAVFTGDARYAPRTAAVNVGTRVAISLKLSKYYKTKKIGGTTYRYYRAANSAYFRTTMTSGPTRKVNAVVQRYSGGKWRTTDHAWFEATDTLYLKGSGLTGAKLRVRTGYVNGGSGDTLNTTTWTAYQYFTFTK